MNKTYSDIRNEIEDRNELSARYLKAREYWLLHPGRFNDKENEFLSSVNRYSRRFTLSDQQMNAFIEIVNAVSNE